MLGRFVMTQFFEFNGQVILIMRIGAGMYWNDLGDIDTHLGKTIYLSRIISHDAQARNIEIVQHRLADFIPPAIGLKAQLNIGLYSVGPGILQRIGFDLI